MAQLFLPEWDFPGNVYLKPTLNDIIIPGTVELSPVKLINATKDNKKPGESGGGVITEGLIPPKFHFTTKITTSLDYLAFKVALANWLPLVNPNLTTAIPVYHPTLALLGVTSCLISEIELMPPHSGGFFGAEIFCIGVSQSQLKAAKSIKPSKGPKINQSKVKPNVNPTFNDPASEANDW
jgi:hypothetical protein